MSVHAHFKRGANVRGGRGGAYVPHPLSTDNQITDVTTNRQDKSPTVTVLGIIFVISQNHFDFFLNPKIDFVISKK